LQNAEYSKNGIYPLPAYSSSILFQHTLPAYSSSILFQHTLPAYTMLNFLEDGKAKEGAAPPYAENTSRATTS
jgi:hypothetical protein